eukprot:6187197-Pleurochrysis_carterae.AAC.1
MLLMPRPVGPRSPCGHAALYAPSAARRLLRIRRLPSVRIACLGARARPAGHAGTLHFSHEDEKLSLEVTRNSQVSGQQAGWGWVGGGNLRRESTGCLNADRHPPLCFA